MRFQFRPGLGALISYRACVSPGRKEETPADPQQCGGPSGSCGLTDFGVEVLGFRSLGWNGQRQDLRLRMGV